MAVKYGRSGARRGLRLSREWIPAAGLLFFLATVVAAGYGFRNNGQAINVLTDVNQKQTIRVGYFPNITHIQAMVGQNNGTFQNALGEQVLIAESIFNAGPKLIQALLTGEIDLGYIGPVPGINGNIVSNKGLQIIAGAANEGAILVAAKGANIRDVADLDGKKVAVPQLAATQDLTLRRLMKGAGLKDASRGGTVTVVPAENPDILTLIAKGEVDAALVPEPWGSRIIKETGANVVLEADQLWEDGSYATTVVIATTKFLEEQPELVEKWLAAHVELTERINNDPETYKQVFNKQFKRLTQKSLPQDVLESSFERLLVTYDPEVSSVQKFAALMADTGYLKQKPDISQLFNLAPLNRVLREKGLAEVN